MISQTQINTYLSCSKKYFFRYIEKREPSNETTFDNLFVGAFVHNYINAFFSGIKDFNFILYETLKRKEFFKNKEDFESFVYIKDFDNIDLFKKHLKNLLKENVYETVFEDKKEVLKTKTNTIINLFDTSKRICNLLKEKYLELNDFKNVKSEEKIEVEDVHGFVDLIEFDVDTIKIIDFKVSKRKKDFKKTVQDLLYVYLFKKKYDIIPVFEYINVVFSNVNNVEIEILKTILNYDDFDLQEAEEMVQAFRSGVENNVFIKNNSSFLCSQDFCEYYNFCNRI